MCMEKTWASHHTSNVWHISQPHTALEGISHRQTSELEGQMCTHTHHTWMHVACVSCTHPHTLVAQFGWSMLWYFMLPQMGPSGACRCCCAWMKSHRGFNWALCEHSNAGN